MKNLKASAVALVALSAVTIGYVATRARAFTLIEKPYSTVAVDIAPGQMGGLKAVNAFGMENITVTLSFVDQAGAVLMSSPATLLAPGQASDTFQFTNADIMPVTVRGVIIARHPDGTSDSGNVLSGIALSNAAGETLGVLPAVQKPPVTP